MTWKYWAALIAVVVFMLFASRLPAPLAIVGLAIVCYLLFRKPKK